MDLGYLRVSPGDLAIEKTQAVEEGLDVGDLLQRLDELIASELKTSCDYQAALDVLDEIQTRPVVAGYRYDEPSDLEAIRARRRSGPRLTGRVPVGDELMDRLHGAWLGRCCGCLLGKPVEGWRRPRMHGYLRDLGRFPLNGYFSGRVPEGIAERYDVRSDNPAMIENVTAMPEDDDLNYTVVGLAVLERHGRGFGPADVAGFWMSHIPILHTFTAERVAYRNLVNLIPPPESAWRRNPYREWIGAQIRADAFGYAAPGNPSTAAALAWQDACVSHVKNGIYGEMWAAATIAAAFVAESIEEALLAGLAEIPERSRLVEALDRVMAWAAEGIGYDDAVERLHREWDENTAHGWCHTISNAMVVAIGLLWGEGDYALSICRAVQCCFDTDCNGATVGSIMGAWLGRQRLPEGWVAPINDTFETGVAGFHRVTCAEMARRTARIATEPA